MSEPTTQWHPMFTHLLRTLVEGHYEVRTNLPVGDLPREADIVLVRRTSATPPFRTLLSHLTTWNVIEFKGRSVSARFRDIDLLVELGLGVDRKLNEDRAKEGLEPLGPEQVSFWYIVNHFGDRFVEEARAVFGTLDEASPGVWRSQILRRPVFLIDSRGVAVDRESVAVHLVGEGSPESERELARVIVDEPGYWGRYGGYLATSHPNILEEVGRMATANAKPGDLDLGPLIELVGTAKIVEALDPQAIKSMGVEHYLAKISGDLPPEKQKQLYELFGVKEPTRPTPS